MAPFASLCPRRSTCNSCTSGYNGASNRIVYFSNDGGIFKNNDVLTAAADKGWVSLNHNFGVTQFYGGAGNPYSGRVLAGAQDNGTLVYSPPPGSNTGPNGFVADDGGDGGFVAADQTDPNMMYGEYVYLQIYRSIDGGNKSNFIYDGIEDAGNDKRALFIAPFILDPVNPETMLAGGASLWRTPNVTSATPAWMPIKDPLAPSALISAIEARPSTSGIAGSDVIWVGYTDGNVYRTTNGLAGQPTWSAITDGANPSSLPKRFVTRIRVDPKDGKRIFVAFSGYEPDNLWRTTDGGVTWKKISEALPAVSVYDIAIHPRDPKLLYLATEVGMFASGDGGDTWWPTNQGPANVAVGELFWMQEKLMAVTHGRGIFWIDLSGVEAVALAAPAAAPGASILGGGPAAIGMAGQIRSLVTTVIPDQHAVKQMRTAQ